MNFWTIIFLIIAIVSGGYAYVVAEEAAFGIWNLVFFLFSALFAAGLLASFRTKK